MVPARGMKTRNLQGGTLSTLDPLHPSFDMPYKSDASQRAYQRAYRLRYKQTHKKRSITLTKAEDRLFVRRAKEERISAATLIKRMALAYVRQERFVPSELLDRLDGITFLLRNYGNNLNQIAHRLNVDTVYRRVHPSSIQALNILRDLYDGFQSLESEIKQQFKEIHNHDYQVSIRKNIEFSKTVCLYQSQIRRTILHITQSQSV